MRYFYTKNISMMKRIMEVKYGWKRVGSCLEDKEGTLVRFVDSEDKLRGLDINVMYIDDCVDATRELTRNGRIKTLSFR